MFVRNAERSDKVEEHKTNTRKRNFKLIGIALLILLPTILAIVAFKLISDNYSLFYDDTYNIRLYDGAGNLIAEDRASPDEAKEGSTVALFAPITESFFETSKIPQSVNKNKYIRAVVEYANELNEYIFYFSTIDDSIYCMEDRKKTYQLSAADATEILSSRYAEQFYAVAVPPVLTTMSGDIILPYNVNWKYKSVSGEYFRSKSYEISNDEQSYTLSGALEVSFASLPDRATAVVIQDGNEVFSGDYSDMSNAEFDKSLPVEVEIIAEWYETPNSDFFGRQSYSFSARVTERAEFAINGESFDVGEICLITVDKIEDVSRIRFSSSPSLPQGIEFHKSANGAVTVIPITKEMENCEYHLVISYGSSFKSFSLSVNEDREDGKLILYPIGTQDPTVYYNDNTLAELSELKRFSYDNSRGDKLYAGEFLDYSTLGGSIRAGFGDYYKISSLYFESEATEYVFEKVGGAGVKAINNGRVIKTGYNIYLGNYVIVSHGAGISTWYAHLGTLDVRDGQYLVRGETLGKAGRSGLSERENVLVFACIRGEFVDVEKLVGKIFE